MNVFGQGLTIQQNRVGEVNLEGIRVSGDYGTLTRNSVTAAAGSGFMIFGSRTYLSGNVASGGFENGFTIDSPGATAARLVSNQALSNAGQGIAIMFGAPAASVVGNVASGNRVDFCDDGVGTSASGNTFGTTAATGGTDCPLGGSN
jgi:hypothetical protein